jgi:hypothetical protein
MAHFVSEQELYTFKNKTFTYLQKSSKLGTSSKSVQNAAADLDNFLNLVRLSQLHL